LSLEEVAKNFGDEVAVHVHDVDEESRLKLDAALDRPCITANSEAKVVEDVHVHGG
jgi:hypothetical protein